ncbi:hypothetical protein NE237_024072 [Protea cynaroides]|uniref:3-ketoacyl-CoA synthase n=1 Tax=Protea cynaroides TaxID=273540 RepID=A0A9Q0HG65_9MAGN|nr:hypothetical protein NE237_024072 [Protea cynaroides]
MVISLMEDVKQLWLFHQHNIFIYAAIMILVSLLYMATRPSTIYLLDHCCYRGQPHQKARFHQFMEHSSKVDDFHESSLEFQRRILERSGIGEETYVPSGMCEIPPCMSLAFAREEAHQVIFGALDSLFLKTSINPKDIGILVINCSLFNPIPSLSSMIINKYKLSKTIKNFTLSGMGCSAGIISIGLARDLLRIHRTTSYAVVVSTENITQNWYFGNNKSMLIPNCLFRVGGAAILLSNNSGDRRRAKYKLLHVVRTHHGDDDKSFYCIHQDQDKDGKVGISLSKDLTWIAAEALKANLTTLGPLVLPIREQLYFITVWVRRMLLGDKVRPYVPDFKLAFMHFCIHAGGKALIDKVRKELRLLAVHVEPSRMTLHRFGNTSSSSIWYELAYIEAKRRMRKGHRVCQLSLGSGFKCNNAVWEALSDIKPTPTVPWDDCIHRYPVET